MATYTANETIIGTTAGAEFITNHRQWGGGTATFSGTEDLIVNGASAVVNADDCIITCAGFNNGTVQGTMNFNNVTLSTSTGNTPAAAVNLNWNNVTVLRQSAVYGVIGCWNPVTNPNPTYDWDNIVLSGGCDEANEFIGLNLFIGALTAASTFDNVSFWNGVDLNEGTQGAILQTSPILGWSQPTFAPAGTRLNNGGQANARILIRIGLQNTPSSPTIGSEQRNTDATPGANNQSNHWTAMLSIDARAWSQLDPANITAFSMDGGDVWLVNPFMGNPGGGATSNLQAGTTFNGGNAGRLRYLIGSNPVTTAGGTEHWYTFNQAFEQGGIYEHPTTLNTLVPPVVANTGVAGQVFKDFQTGFFVDINSISGGTYYNTTSTSTNNVSNLVNLIAPGNVWYRKHSWLQQPDNTTFHRRIDVGVTDGSGDDIGFINNGEDTQPFIDAGYDLSSSAGFTTNTNVDDPVDALTTETGFSTVALATASYDGAASQRDGSHIVGQLKTVAIEDANTPDVANTQVLLPYTVAAGNVDLGARAVTISEAATRAYDGTTASIRSQALVPTSSESVVSVEANSFAITATGEAWNDTTNKLRFNGVTTLNGDFNTLNVNGNTTATGDLTSVNITGTLDLTGSGISVTTSGATDISASSQNGVYSAAGAAVSIDGNSIADEITSATTTIGGNSTITEITSTGNVSIGGTSTGTTIGSGNCTITGASNGTEVTATGSVTLVSTSDNDTLSGTAISVSGTTTNADIDGTTSIILGNVTGGTYDAPLITATGAIDGGTFNCTSTAASGRITFQNATSLTGVTATANGNAGQDIYANNIGNVTNCSFTAGDEIRTTGNTVVGGFMRTTDLINADANASFQDIELAAVRLQNLSAQGCISGITFDTVASNGTMTIDLDSLNGQTISVVEDILGEGYDFGSNIQTLVIDNNTGSTVTVSVDQDTVDMLSPYISGLAGFGAGDDDRTIMDVIYTFPAAALVSYDVTIGGTLDEIKARGGRFAIWNETTSAPVLAPHTITSSTTLGDITASRLSDNEHIWRIYYKPATGWGTGRTAYGMTLNADGTILSIGQISAPVSVGVNVHVSAITDGSETEPPTSLGTYSSDGSGTSYTAIFAVDTAQNQPTDANLAGGATQALCLEAANSEGYFLSHYNRALTRELFAPGSNNGSDWRDLSDPVNPVTRTDGAFMFTSGDTDATPPRQQIISQISGLVTQNLNGYNQVIGVTEGNATIATVQGAVAGAVATGVDTALTNAGAATRQDLANGFNTGQVFENGAPVGVNTNA